MKQEKKLRKALIKKANLLISKEHIDTQQLDSVTRILQVIGTKKEQRFVDFATNTLIVGEK